MTQKKPETKKSTKIEDKFLIIEHDNCLNTLVDASKLQEKIKQIDEKTGLYNVKVFDVKKLKLYNINKTSVFSLVEN